MERHYDASCFVTFVNKNYCGAEFWPSIFITCETPIYFLDLL